MSSISGNQRRIRVNFFARHTTQSAVGTPRCPKDMKMSGHSKRYVHATSNSILNITSPSRISPMRLSHRCSYRNAQSLLNPSADHGESSIYSISMATLAFCKQLCIFIVPHECTTGNLRARAQEHRQSWIRRCSYYMHIAHVEMHDILHIQVRSMERAQSTISPWPHLHFANNYAFL
jgi:hypothetical protein